MDDILSHVLGRWRGTLREALREGQVLWEVSQHWVGGCPGGVDIDEGEPLF